jgi:hypothetical protein
MVAERLGLDMEGAFTALRNHARNHNVKLVVLAKDVIEGAVLPSALDHAPRSDS